LMDQVLVLLIGLPPSTPNPWSAQIRPNTARIECGHLTWPHFGRCSSRILAPGW
jgi:hypothetical protein